MRRSMFQTLFATALVGLMAGGAQAAPAIDTSFFRTPGIEAPLGQSIDWGLRVTNTGDVRVLLQSLLLAVDGGPFTPLNPAECLTGGSLFLVAGSSYDCTIARIPDRLGPLTLQLQASALQPESGVRVSDATPAAYSLDIVEPGTGGNVPEPATLGLAAAALVAGAAVRRRRVA